ncbi:hypothetical protein CVT26_007429 [Gymnopilus dilepis]|uniref:Uncharacterized protein n=1 Tax=Gymnopilus dilepis TaxID=231916 RepID=A0A409WQ49_9AGAR|nr:hypothetical protein CVT26_007429 [Gymnopilus dilepis]
MESPFVETTQKRPPVALATRPNPTGVLQPRAFEITGAKAKKTAQCARGRGGLHFVLKRWLWFEREKSSKTRPYCFPMGSIFSPADLALRFVLLPALLYVDVRCS